MMLLYQRLASKREGKFPVEELVQNYAEWQVLLCLHICPPIRLNSGSHPNHSQPIFEKK